MSRFFQSWVEMIGSATLALVSVLIMTSVTRAAPPKATGREFRMQLEQPVGLSWKDIPLREALNALAEDRRVNIYLDRRVDPSKKISLTINNEPLANALEKIAQSQQLGACLVGHLIYIGPTEDVDRLRTVLSLRKEDLAKLPLKARAPYTSQSSLSWPDLTTPGELIEQLSKSGVRVYGQQKIAHDLWAAGEWPRLAWLDQLGLIAAQFDHTIKFSPDGRAVALVRIPADLSINDTAGQLPKVAPAKPQGGKQVYTLKIENQPIGKLLRVLGRQLGVELTIDEAAISTAGKSLDTLVSFDIRGADLDALLHAATNPAGLSFERSEKRVKIVPRR